MNHPLRLLQAGLVLLTGLLFLPAAGALSAPLPVAYVEPSYPDRNLADLIVVKRLGAPQLLRGRSFDLEPGDQIFVQSKGIIVTVRYIATNAVVRVGHSDRNGPNQADLTVGPSSIQTLPDQIRAWFEEQLSSADHDGKPTPLASKGIVPTHTCFNETGRTDDPTRFDIPILAADKSQIVAGERALYISWQGGARPYSITLAEAETGRVVVQTTGVHEDCSARLPQTSLQSGRYTLTLTDANNVQLQLNTLVVMPVAPDMPAQLKAAALTEDTRQLYFATWLSVVDNGEWAFEAEQRVSAMDCRSQAVQDWLKRWGGGLSCDNVGG